MKLNRNRTVILSLLSLIGSFAFYLLWSDRCEPFARHIMRPKPPSVSSIRIEGSDWLGLNPEPVVRIAFNANSGDMTAIISHKKLRPAAKEEAEWFVTRGGSSWWSAGRMNDGSQFFMHSGRRGQEYLRIDETGTNAFYLLWGI